MLLSVQCDDESKTKTIRSYLNIEEISNSENLFKFQFIKCTLMTSIHFSLLSDQI